jgi:hypothetical protein
LSYGQQHALCQSTDIWTSAEHRILLWKKKYFLCQLTSWSRRKMFKAKPWVTSCTKKEVDTDHLRLTDVKLIDR